MSAKKVQRKTSKARATKRGAPRKAITRRKASAAKKTAPKARRPSTPKPKARKAKARKAAPPVTALARPEEGPGGQPAAPPVAIVEVTTVEVVAVREPFTTP